MEIAAVGVGSSNMLGPALACEARYPDGAPAKHLQATEARAQGWAASGPQG
jgi:hypothetical protein